ncbi:hypothetical protein [Acidovorax sp.]|uniref:hypothetical protein n=1 Tax=Acidovorax sp. TaxID=1872122 RepID=UPI003919430E
MKKLLTVVAFICISIGASAQQDEAERERARLAALRADFDRQAREDAMQEQIQRQNQALQQMQQQQQQQQIINGLMLMEAARPRPAPNPLMAPSVSCQSRYMGGAVYTNCN